MEARKKFAEELKELSKKCGLKSVCWCENKNAKTSTFAYSIHELYFNDGTSINAMELLKAMDANTDEGIEIH